MSADGTSDEQRDARGSAPAGAGPEIEFGDDLGMVVEVVHALAAAQASQLALVQTLIGVVDDLMTAYGALHESLEAQADALSRGGADTIRGRRGTEVGEELVPIRLALREQAHRLHHHADHLQRQVNRAGGRAESLAERAAELMRESERIVAARSGRSTGSRTPGA